MTDEEQTYRLAQVVEDTIRVTDIKLDKDFPVSGFSTVAFESSSARKRALIIGGYALSGQCTNSRWSMEYAPTIKGLYRLTQGRASRPLHKVTAMRPAAAL